MPRQLTPEERAIIRETEEQGAREAQARGGNKGSGKKMLAGWLMIIGFFVILFLVASVILSTFN
jgi:hypothetical protein